MCDYTQREYSCGHFRWIASRWCKAYATTGKKCQPNVTDFEEKVEEVCGECKPKECLPWENLLKRRGLVSALHTRK